MNRTHLLKLIASQLDFLNGKHHGLKSSYTQKELANADVILTTLEEAGMRWEEKKSEDEDDFECVPV